MTSTQSVLLRPRPYAKRAGSFALVALLPPPKPAPALPSEIWTGIFEFLVAGSEALRSLLLVCKLFKVCSQRSIHMTRPSDETYRRAGARVTACVRTRSNFQDLLLGEIHCPAAVSRGLLGLDSPRTLVRARPMGANSGSLWRRMRWTIGSAHLGLSARQDIPPRSVPPKAFHEPVRTVHS